MSVNLRRGVPGDAEVAGRICYEGFGEIAKAHNFEGDLPSVEVAQLLVGTLLGNANIYSVVAELDRCVCACNSL